MAQPHYVLRRSRSGRFNFTLLTGNGRLAGVVCVPTDGRTESEIRQHAHEEIRALVGEFVGIQGEDGTSSDERSM